MRSRFLIFLVAAAIGYAQPVITSILNSASSNEMFSPGCWVSIYGTNLSGGSAQASTVPLPKSLSGSSVTIGGRPALLNYISPTQINAMIPYEVPATGMQKIDVIVSSDHTDSGSYPIYVNRNAPALFTRDGAPNGRVLIFDAFFRPVDIPANQQAVILYASGLGQTDPPVTTETSGTTSAQVTDEIEVFVGDQKAEVLYAGLAPGFPGVYQLNVRVQALWTDRIYLRQRGWIGNIAQVGITPGNNATNVRGTIIGTYPRPDTIVEWSQLLEAASTTVELDLTPAAKPFVIAAVSDAAGRFMQIDPVNRMYHAWTTSPSNAGEATGNFSQLTQPLLDIANGCIRTPNNVIPPARLDQSYTSIAAMLGPASPLIPGDPTGIRESAWSLRSPASFGDSDAFGGFVQLPCGSIDTHSTTFKLYVDGKLVDSKAVRYRVAHH